MKRLSFTQQQIVGGVRQLELGANRISEAQLAESAGVKMQLHKTNAYDYAPSYE